MTKIKFNDEQLQAINFYKGNCGVIASAGSGKTTLMLERINRLITVHNVDPKDILTISFTNNTASELKKRLEANGYDNVNVGTFHSMCGSILFKEGKQLSPDKLIKDWQVDNCFRSIDQKVNVEDVRSFISYQKNYMVGVNDKFVEKQSDYDEGKLRQFYKAYEELKNKNNMHDFDDYLLKCLDLLKANPDKHTYKFVLVDEHQDSNGVQNELLKYWTNKNGNLFVVGDYRQCFPIGTPVNTPNGFVNIEELKVSDNIIVASGRGETEIRPVSEIITKEYKGKLIQLKTKRGNIIQATPEHTIFLDTKIDQMKHFVYLMYKEDYGFRIGRSSQYNVLRENKVTKENGYERRLINEHADKLWILKTVDNVEDACYFENYYSYQYGIPQYVFKYRGDWAKGLSPERIVELFKNIDTVSRANKLLKEKGLFFERPHSESLGFLTEKTNKPNKRRINFVMFGASRKARGYNNEFVGYNHEMSATSIDENYVSIVANIWGKNYYKNSNGQQTSVYCHTRWTGNDQDTMLNKAYESLDFYKHANIQKKAVLVKDKSKKFKFMPIANAITGMKVPVFVEGEIVIDEIVEIKEIEYNGMVYDLNIDLYRNYITNNIVVHNCVYGFRGGNPEHFMEFDENWSNATMLNVSTNYRSPRNVVNKANDFIKQYYGGYEHYKDAIPHSNEDGLIEINSYQSEVDEAEKVVDQIEELISNGANLNEIAVLYRLNKQSNYIEGQLKERNIEYDIDNNSSFFKRREVAAIIAYMRLINDTNDDNAFDTVFRSRNHPFKFFSNALFNDMQTYASKNNVTLYEALQEINYPKPWLKKNALLFVNIIEQLKEKYKRSSGIGKAMHSLIDAIVDAFQIKEGINDKYSSPDEIEERLESINVLKTFVKMNNLEQFINFVYTSSEKKKTKKNAVRLLSVHKSKGMEYENVFVVGVKDGDFPSRRAEDINEESRLFYVAVTRTKQNMWISEIGRRNKFIKEYKGEC